MDMKKIKSSMDVSRPKRHTPPTNPKNPINNMNMSPVEGYKLVVFRSMQNAQMLTECGELNKCVCKHIRKKYKQTKMCCIYRCT